MNFQKKIMEDLNLEYEIISTSWDNAQQMIKDGDADVLLGASYSKSREEFLYYTDEQKNWNKSKPFPSDTIKLGEYRFVVKIENKQKYVNWTYESLRNSKTRIGAIAGTSIMDTLSKEKENIYSFKETSHALELLNDEGIDLFIGVNIGSEIDIIENNLTQHLTLIKKPLTQKPYFILFSKRSEKEPLKGIRISFHNKLIELKEKKKLYEIYNDELRKYGFEYSKFDF